MAKFLGLSDDPQWRTFVFRWLALSLLIHLVTAVLSVGHHSADEYFQILEFLSYQLGKTPTHHLPIEFKEQMRPWMQPGIYWCITQVWQFIGVYNPFTWATSFRVFTGLIGWLSTVGLALCSRFWFIDLRARKFAVISLALIWLFPVLHVRPSSESLAGSTFLIALSLAYLTWRQEDSRRENRDQNTSRVLLNACWLAVGLLLGFCFEFRFQMGLMIFGIFSWLFFHGCRAGRMRYRSLIPILLGAGLVFVLGRWVDYWGYGRWVMSPMNYYNFNLVRGEVSKYGGSPWWDVFRMSMTETWPLLGFLLAVSTAVAWIRYPQHILTWSQIPFFLVHEIIGHKELRFFFPIAFAGPILLTLSLTAPGTQRFISLNKKVFSHRLLFWFWGFLVVNDLAAVTSMMFLPMARTVQFYQGVYNSVPPKTKKFELFTLDRDPYILLGNPVYFYRPLELTVTKFDSFTQLKDIILNRKEPIWLFDSHFHLPTEAEPVHAYCHSVYQIFPPYIEAINWGNWLERTLTWTLYRCQK